MSCRCRQWSATALLRAIAGGLLHHEVTDPTPDRQARVYVTSVVNAAPKTRLTGLARLGFHRIGGIWKQSPDHPSEGSRTTSMRRRITGMIGRREQCQQSRIELEGGIAQYAYLPSQQATIASYCAIAVSA